MTNNKYIIKHLAPWMVDELIAFAEITKFDIIFLREQDDFYDETVRRLSSKDINIYTKPKSYNNLFKKLRVIIEFFVLNLYKFKLNYNGVIGIKSIWWFLFLDISIFSKNSNIHAQFATQATLISLLIKRYFENSPTYSFTFHAYDIYFKNYWLNMLIKNSYRSFSISEYNLKYVGEHYHYSDKLKLSRLGVFRDINEKSRDNVESNIFELGLLSWFTHKKGIYYLLQAMLELKKKGYGNIKLNLAGDGPLRDELLKFIDKNQLTGMIDYFGKIKEEQKEQFYKSIDVFILPCISLKNDQDGIPVVLMEAIANALPIISTEVSGIPEICKNNFNGFLIKEKDVQAIVDSIIDLFENAHDRRRFSKNSLLISQDYDIQLNSIKKAEYLNW